MTYIKVQKKKNLPRVCATKFPQASFSYLKIDFNAAIDNQTTATIDSIHFFSYLFVF